jgi:ribosomal-protein-alanine N-acetyltransferase
MSRSAPYSSNAPRPDKSGPSASDRHWRLTTERLVLRPLHPSDAPTLQTLCGNWNVARMLAVVPHPYPDGLAESWIATHADARADGSAYTFAIERDGTLIGVIGLDRRDRGHELGYWIGEPWWGNGYAAEAVRRVIAFAFDDLELDRLSSSHFKDNPASAHVLRKCGFHVTGEGQLDCVARGAPVPSVFMALVKPLTPD